MSSCEMTWPKSEEKPKLGVGGVYHGDAVPPMYRSCPLPPNFKLVVQPLPFALLLLELHPLKVALPNLSQFSRLSPTMH